MPLNSKEKGISQTLGIVIAVVVLGVAALAVVTSTTGPLSKTGTSTKSIQDEGNQGYNSARNLIGSGSTGSGSGGSTNTGTGGSGGNTGTGTTGGGGSGSSGCTKVGGVDSCWEKGNNYYCDTATKTCMAI